MKLTFGCIALAVLAIVSLPAPKLQAQLPPMPCDAYPPPAPCGCPEFIGPCPSVSAGRKLDKSGGTLLNVVDPKAVISNKRRQK